MTYGEALACVSFMRSSTPTEIRRWRWDFAHHMAMSDYRSAANYLAYLNEIEGVKIDPRVWVMLAMEGVL